MCGISGWVGFKKNTNQALKRVKKINDTLSHRGPDSSGVTQFGNVILAMRRLAIIDIEGGQQPLFTENKNIAIVGNGELYNYLELQKKLKLSGHQLTTKSDIEVFAHLYEDFGPDAVHKVRGMFAIALHDRKKKKLFLFRDRIGEKPLYYTLLQGEIFFASELKSLLQLPIKKTLDQQAIDSYFHLYYVPEPKTPLVAISKVPAGSYVEVDCQTLQTKCVQYWELSTFHATKTIDPTQVIKKEFERSCQITLRSDVPVAISLSSGIDSSAIATVASKYAKDNLVAVTVGYKNAKKVDERSGARELTNKLGIEHITDEMDDKSIAKDFPKLVWDCDDLLAEIGMFNINAIYKTAKKHGIKVLLSGVGGDEFFWGYPWMKKAAFFSLKKRIQAKNKILKKIKRIVPTFLQSHKMYIKSLGILNYLVSPSEQIVLNDIRPPFRGGEFFLRHLYHSSFKKKIDRNKTFSFLNAPITLSSIELLQWMQRLVCQRWLVSHVIPINDRLSMANGVELRLPLLDYKLAEVCFTHKKTIGAYNKKSKHYFRKALKDTLSEDLMSRPKKGFTPPVARWLWQIIVNYRYLLTDGFLVKEKIIDKRLLPVIWLCQFIPIVWYPLFQLLVLEVWGREYVYGQNYAKIRPKKQFPF